MPLILFFLGRNHFHVTSDRMKTLPLLYLQWYN